MRGTFSLVHGREAVLADMQEPVGGDRHYADDPRQSLWASTELALYKPRTDVMLVGSAFAPDQEPVDALIARLSLGELDKSIGVIGDRVWIEGPDGPEPSAPKPFAVMPLRYERAARAPDNPSGFDLTGAPAIGALALPNLEAADDEIGRVRTIGFGPVLPAAGTRRALLPSDSWAWLEAGAQGPLPAGFDFAFYNAAPRDQQIDLVRSGASLVLENLSRRHARLETRLPTVRPKAFLVPADEERGAEIALRCDTVWIDTDRALMTLTWRGILAVPTTDEDALGALVIAAESKGREIGYKQIAKLLREGLSTTTDSDTFSETSPLGVRHDDGMAPAAPRVDSRHTPPARVTPEPYVPPRPVAGTLPLLQTAPAVVPFVPIAPAASPPVPAMIPLVPIAPAPPVVIEAEDTGTPIWDELSSSDVFEATATDEPKTLQRLGAPSRIEDPLSEEPATSPAFARVDAVTSLLGAADYARIAASIERNDAARVLFGYGLTLPDLPRLTRMWTDRVAADPSFAETFARELASARRDR
ncbi:putative exported protein [Minicystis rosea]|nr:putative exported protein [Minicystis rosea]